MDQQQQRRLEDEGMVVLSLAHEAEDGQINRVLARVHNRHNSYYGALALYRAGQFVRILAAGRPRDTIKQAVRDAAEMECHAIQAS